MDAQQLINIIRMLQSQGVQFQMEQDDTDNEEEMEQEEVNRKQQKLKEVYFNAFEFHNQLTEFMTTPLKSQGVLSKLS